MKRIFILMAMIIMFATKTNVIAAEEFDAEFYANQNPDVVEQLGDNPEVLHNHYITYGKAEGRLPYQNAPVPVQITVGRVGETSNAAYQEVLNQLTYIPENLKSCFIKKGWVLNLTSEDIAQTIFNGKYNSVQGVTCYNEKYIKIQDRKIAAKEATIHEFGHFLNDASGRDSEDKQKELTDAYEAEKNNKRHSLSGAYVPPNCDEFYAEVFRWYCIDKQNVSVTYPLMTQIFEADLASVS